MGQNQGKTTPLPKDEHITCNAFADEDVAAEGGKASSVLHPVRIAHAVYAGIREAATTLRSDCAEAIQQAWHASNDAHPDACETSVLRSMIENSLIGKEHGMPICQDTGSVWVCLEVGEALSIPGNIFSLVPEAVRAAYTEGKLRMSLVKDALFDRSNTTDNNPAFCEIKLVPGRACKIHIMLKGGGSDNASRIIMLPPSAGKEGIKREVLACVFEKAANACPPLIVGVGVGATFDKVAGLSKQALLRPIGSPAQSEEAAAFERELLDAINETGIGAAALGGHTTALAVHLNTAPCHIAALPLAINMGCSAMRSATYELINDEGIALSYPAAQTWEYEDTL